MIELQVTGLGQAVVSIQQIGAVLDAPEQVFFLVEQDLNALVDLSFVDSKDPYGDDWEPLKYREGQPLIKDNNLRVSFDSFLDSTGLLMFNSMEYSGVHQYGTTSAGRNRDIVIPRRMFFPDGKLGLPKEWVDEIVDGFNQLLQ